WRLRLAGRRIERARVVVPDLTLEVLRAIAAGRVISIEVVLDLRHVPVLGRELVPQLWSLRLVVARLVGVTHPDAIGLILVVAAVVVVERGIAERGGLLRDRAHGAVADPRRPDHRGLARDLAEGGMALLAAAMFVGRVRDLVAEDERQLVVVE